MLQTGTRGGQELRGMNCSQFQPKYQEQIGYYYLFQPMLQGSFKNYAGGIKDCKKVRKPIHIFNEPTVMDCFNPYKVIDTYFSLLPPGWTGEGTMNPLFLTPKKNIINGVGFTKTPRGRNFTGKYLQYAMKRIGIEGKFTNTQVRSAVITGAMELGMRDNQIRDITGHRSETALNSYKQPSLKWQKVSRAKMLSSVIYGSTSWSGIPKVESQKAICPVKSPDARQEIESIPTQTNFNGQTVVSSNRLYFGRKRRHVANAVSKQQKMQIAQRNQELFKMLIDQQTMIMQDENKEPTETVEEVYTQANTQCPQNSDMQQRHFGKRLTDNVKVEKPKKRFRLASELGLSLD